MLFLDSCCDYGAAVVVVVAAVVVVVAAVVVVVAAVVVVGAAVVVCKSARRSWSSWAFTVAAAVVVAAWMVAQFKKIRHTQPRSFEGYLQSLTFR